MSDLWSAATIFAELGRRYSPTDEQAAVIEYPMEPLLVVAGAGAGKTETMANRVVWMVANGLIRADEVLGLTFTRKAAAELEHRIRRHLTALRESPLIRNLAADDPRRAGLDNIQPTVSTYDAFMGNVLKEYGLLLPIEPTATIAEPLDEWMLARDLLNSWPTELSEATGSATVVDTMLDLFNNITNNLLTLDEVDAETAAAAETLRELEEQSIEEHRILVEELAAAGKKRKPRRPSVEDQLAVQNYRRELLRLIEAHEQRLNDHGLVTFGQQTSAAARLVTTHPEVVSDLRERYGAVFLDEYQDTNHAQRIVLATLFGQCFQGEDGSQPTPGAAQEANPHERGRGRLVATTAVGDPMQCIYSWRGAAVANLPRFPHDFRYQRPDEDTIRPAHKLELTTSFRNPQAVLTLANAVADHALDGHILPHEVKEATWGALAPGVLDHCTSYEAMNRQAQAQETGEVISALAEDEEGSGAAGSAAPHAASVNGGTPGASSDGRDTGEANPAGQASAPNPAAPAGGHGSQGRFVTPLSAPHTAAQRPIDPENPAAPRIDVRWWRNETDELEWLVSALVTEFEKTAQDHPLSAAVLVRKNEHIGVVAQALTARGIPVEVAPGPLHEIPEVQQILAMATLVINPHDQAAALQVLTNPRWNLGIADLNELAQRAKQLSADIARPATGTARTGVDGSAGVDAARARFDAQVAEILAQRAATPAALGDAIADLDANTTDSATPDPAAHLRPHYTPDAAARLRTLSSHLRALRQRVGTLGVADMIADIEIVMGLRAEVLARSAPGDPLAGGAVHLDRLLDEAHKADAQGRTLAEFVQMMKMSGSDRAFHREAGEVKVRPNCVQILTVHKAKGLEWDIVAVPFVHSGSYKFPVAARGVKVSTWLNRAEEVPSHLCGDAFAADNPQGRPLLPLDTPDLTAADVEQQYNDLRLRALAFESLEVMRVFYVAITRAKRRLIVSGNFDPKVKVSTAKRGKKAQTTQKAQKAQAAQTNATAAAAAPAAEPAVTYEWSLRAPAFGFGVVAHTVAAQCGVDLDEWIRATEEEGDGSSPELDLHHGVWHLHLVAPPTEPPTEDDKPVPRSAVWPFDAFDPTGERAAIAAAHPGGRTPHRRRDVEEAAALVEQAAHARADRCAASDDTATSTSTPAAGAAPAGPVTSASATSTSTPGALDTASAHPSELAVLWAREATALIEDARARAHGVPQHGVGVELSTTELIGAAKDPEEFLRRRLRPIPFKPNLYAKRGTAFHNWLEQRFGGAQTLIDDDALAYLSGDGLVGEQFLESSTAETAEFDPPRALTDEQLHTLKEAFLASPWAERTPRLVEQPFMVKLGRYFVRGRMDAVFHEGDDESRGWTIVDWKTGRKPQGAAMHDASIQLAIYRMALVEQLRLRGVEEPEVAAVFHYVRDNHTYAPSTLPTAEELVRTLDSLNS